MMTSLTSGDSVPVTFLGISLTHTVKQIRRKETFSRTLLSVEEVQDAAEVESNSF